MTTTTTADLSLRHKLDVAVRIRKSAERWGRTESDLLRQMDEMQGYRCALTRAILDKDCMSWLRDEGERVFVLPLVSVLLESFGHASAVHVLAAVAEAAGRLIYADELRARYGCRCTLRSTVLFGDGGSDLVDFIRRCTEREGRFIHGFTSPRVQARPTFQVASASFSNIPFRCTQSGVSFSMLMRDPSSPVFMMMTTTTTTQPEAAVSALYWITHKLKYLSWQLRQLSVMMTRPDSTTTTSPSTHEQTFCEFVRAATRWCA